MPREQTLPKRVSGTKVPARFIVIASEGMRAEPQYFKSLEKHCDQNIVHPVHVERAKEESGLSAPQHILAQMQTFKKARASEFKKGDEFWLVLDYDQWPNLEDIVALCEEEGIQVAISRACFELWLLLHIVEVKDLDQETTEKLLANKRLNPKHTFTSKLHGERMKEVTGRNFSKERINAPALMPYIENAIERAKALTGDDIIPSGLGSGVYRIAEQVKLLPTPETPNS